MQHQNQQSSSSSSTLKQSEKKLFEGLCFIIYNWSEINFAIQTGSIHWTLQAFQKNQQLQQHMNELTQHLSLFKKNKKDIRLAFVQDIYRIITSKSISSYIQDSFIAKSKISEYDLRSYLKETLLDQFSLMCDQDDNGEIDSIQDVSKTILKLKGQIDQDNYEEYELLKEMNNKLKGFGDSKSQKPAVGLMIDQAEEQNKSDESWMTYDDDDENNEDDEDGQGGGESDEDDDGFTFVSDTKKGKHS